MDTQEVQVHVLVQHALEDSKERGMDSHYVRIPPEVRGRLFDLFIHLTKTTLAAEEKFPVFVLPDPAEQKMEAIHDQPQEAEEPVIFPLTDRIAS